MRLVDTIRVVTSASKQGEVTGPVTSADFGASGDGESQHALLSTKRYKIAGTWKRASSGTVFLDFQPNADASSANYRQCRVGSNDGISVFGAAESRSGLTMALVDSLYAPATTATGFETIFDPRITGLPRPYSSDQKSIDSVGPNAFLIEYSGGWLDLISELTSLRVITSVASDIDVNTLIELYEEDLGI